ncbi:MAG: NfeD family protein [Desulfarculaceae bacterium]|jgi:membrane protein implicated in regulation of membrane protease activity
MFEVFLSAYMIWFFVGLAFALAEMAVPGLILIFFALGAWTTAALVFFKPISLAYQLAFFVVASLILLFVLRRYMRQAFKGLTADDSSQEVDQTDLGKTATVTKPIKPHISGEIKYRGSFWKAAADQEIAEGETVEITGHLEHEKQTFTVKTLTKGEE